MNSFRPFTRTFTLILLSGFLFFSISCDRAKNNQSDIIWLTYNVSFENPENKQFHVQFYCTGLKQDSVELRMARWSPGYYQIMDYGDKLSGFTVKDNNDHDLEFFENEGYSWKVKTDGKQFTVSYDILCDRQFVAENYLDSTHAYLLPAASFLYIRGLENAAYTLELTPLKQWDNIATGLRPIPGKIYTFTADNLDILFDCPILAGKLEELPEFQIDGVCHRFIGYRMDTFDRQMLMSNLEKAIGTATKLIGDIPYEEYTFIGIGPGYGGIEHLNSTAVSFTGHNLNIPTVMTGTLSYLIHEYFHSYNVKRIRPFELGPFDYSRENHTDLLWVSEGFTVYYEYIILKRAGLMNEQEFFHALSANIEAAENDPGRKYQSLAEASYSTWTDGPFGGSGQKDRSISVYDKGACLGLILDLAIREASRNERSLDDLMRLLYTEYYKKQDRGFTAAEFREACEKVAGIPLEKVFKYVYTTREPDYESYLSAAGLKLQIIQDPKTLYRHYSISKSETRTPDQDKLLECWLN